MGAATLDEWNGRITIGDLTITLYVDTNGKYTIIRKGDCNNVLVNEIAKFPNVDDAKAQLLHWLNC